MCAAEEGKACGWIYLADAYEAQRRCPISGFIDVVMDKRLVESEV
jgi:hypothetical protein